MPSFGVDLQNKLERLHTESAKQPEYYRRSNDRDSTESLSPSKAAFPPSMWDGVGLSSDDTTTISEAGRGTDSPSRYGQSGRIGKSRTHGSRGSHRVTGQENVSKIQLSEEDRRFLMEDYGPCSTKLVPVFIPVLDWEACSRNYPHRKVERNPRFQVASRQAASERVGPA